MKIRKIVAVMLVIALAAVSVFAGGSSDKKATTSSGKQIINFWYHSGEPVTDEYFENYFAELNASQDQYEVRYTSFNFADFQDQFQMAVMTDTMPDIVSLGFSNVATFTAQNSLLPLNEHTDEIAEFDKIDPQLLQGMIKIGNGELYGIPFAYNQEVAWMNLNRFRALGITEAPATQAEFLEMCKEYADPVNSRYFYSLRGVRPYDSLVAWLWTWTDGLGYNGSWFDENGECILDRPEFVEALNAYADIYKNKEVSGDSVNNNFDQIIAEFGSGVSAYIIHNSSSEATHKRNLGEGNYQAARVLANDQGHYFASGLQPNVYCVTNQGEDHDYTGAFWLLSILSSADCTGGLCEVAARVPCNTDVYSQEWCQNDTEIKLYQSYLSDPNYYQIDNPYWLPEFSGFITNDMTADFQAVLMGDMTAEDCLKGWADAIDSYQALYEETL